MTVILTVRLRTKPQSAYRNRSRPNEKQGSEITPNEPKHLVDETLRPIRAQLQN